MRNQIEKEANVAVTFLNSPFGIWSLSSIVLAILTSVWQNFLARRKQDEEKHDRLNKIAIELLSRLRQCKANIRQLENTGRFSYSHALSPIVGAELSERSSCLVFPEFDKRTALSLLFEAKYWSPEFNNQIERVIETTNRLVNYQEDFDSCKDASQLCQKILERDIIAQITSCTGYISELSNKKSMLPKIKPELS